MKDIISKILRIINPYFKINICLILTFHIIMIINSNNKEDNDILDNNNLLMILDKERYQQGFKNKEIKENEISHLISGPILLIHKNINKGLFSLINNKNSFEINFNNMIFCYFIFIILEIEIIKLINTLLFINYKNTYIAFEYNNNFSEDTNKYENNLEMDKKNKREICNKINDFSIIPKIETNKKDEIDDIKNIIGHNNSKEIYLENLLKANSRKLLPSGEGINKIVSENKKNMDLEKSKNEEINENDLINLNLEKPKLEGERKFPEFFEIFTKLQKYLAIKNIKINKQKIDINKCTKYNDRNYFISLNLNADYSINCLVPNDELSEFFTLFNLFPFTYNKIDLLPDEKLKNKINNEKSKELKEKSEKKNLVNTLNEDSKSKEKSSEKVGGIWDEDDDDDNDNDNEEEDTENSNNESVSELENIDENIVNKEMDELKINSNCFENRNKNKGKTIIKNEETRTKIMNISRLDKDFKNLEKIGEGGFGIVLKGEHRLDKGLYAIKIIKLNNIKDRENIINEAITMTKLTSKHIVQYKTCWIDNNLGSATKFFDEENDNNSKSCSKIDEKEESESSVNSEDLSLTIKNSNIFYNNENKKDNSQEIMKNISKNRLSKYCCNYRDDSHIETKSRTSKNEYFFILMEYCDGLTLDKYILKNKGKSIDRKTIYNFITQILKSLVKIHSNGIIHRDIKPSNIFIKNENIKIGDFGLATKYNNGKLLESKKIEGTPLYLSPEQKNSKIYNEKVDIYALGITLYEICSSFSTSMERYNSITNLKKNNLINENVRKKYPEESTLIRLMTKNDFNERPSAKEILESELFINCGKSLGY